MFGISGFNPVSLMATAAFGPLGGMAMQVFSQFGQQLLQTIGNQQGLQQSEIEFAQAKFTSQIGDVKGTAKNLDQALEEFGAENNASPREIGDAQRQTQQILQDLVREMSESKEIKDAKANRGKGGGGNTTGAPGWLMAIAETLGEKLNELGDDMSRRASTMQKDDPKASAEFGVVSQQFSMLMNATNNAIKTIGEALAGMAKRQ